MATTFYPTNQLSTAIVVPSSMANMTKRLLSTTRGSGVVTVTDNTVSSVALAIWGSATSIANYPPAATANAGSLAFITNPLFGAALGGASSTTTANIRALESNAKANYGAGFQVNILSADGSTLTAFSGSTSALELGTAESANSVAHGAPPAKTLLDGERLVLIIGYLAVGGTSASGNTASGFYNGTAGGASGDTFVTFTETLTEYVFPGPQAPLPHPALIYYRKNR